MARRRGKRVRRDVYSSNIQRLSVYPNPRSPRESRPQAVRQLRPGDVVEIRVVELDDDGRGIGYYKGARVIVDDVEPGIQVKVRISRVEESGRLAYGVPESG
ncbi:MAG: TRAM domain-containing protein [Desulfurococcales archaeon]|nr:TRAM domain-containing protein [Desulfurococcales archaeon]